jgi:hypothetical protein
LVCHHSFLGAFAGLTDANANLLLSFLGKALKPGKGKAPSKKAAAAAEEGSPKPPGQGSGSKAAVDGSPDAAGSDCASDDGAAEEVEVEEEGAEAGADASMGTGDGAEQEEEQQQQEEEEEDTEDEDYLPRKLARPPSAPKPSNDRSKLSSRVGVVHTGAPPVDIMAAFGVTPPAGMVAAAAAAAAAAAGTPASAASAGASAGGEQLSEAPFSPPTAAAVAGVGAFFGAAPGSSSGSKLPRISTGVSDRAALGSLERPWRVLIHHPTCHRPAFH